MWTTAFLYCYLDIRAPILGQNSKDNANHNSKDSETGPIYKMCNVLLNAGDSLIPVPAYRVWWHAIETRHLDGWDTEIRSKHNKCDTYCYIHDYIRTTEL